MAFFYLTKYFSYISALCHIFDFLSTNNHVAIGDWCVLY